MIRLRTVLMAIGMIFGCTFPEPPPIETDGPVDATADADIDAAPCVETTCQDGVLRVCGAGGIIDDVFTCRLGCFDDGRCNWIDPSNGLDSLLAAADSQLDRELEAGTVVDSDSGAVRGPGGSVIAVATDTVPQVGGMPIRVLLARSWTIAAIRVEGTRPIAFLATRDIRLLGVIDVSADGPVPGAGAAACGVPDRGGDQVGGQWELIPGGGWAWGTDGAGGGGFASAGGAGGSFTDTADPPGDGGVINGLAAAVPLRGGCRGGGANQQGTNSGHGGGGGGAVHLVSAAGEVRVTGSAAGLAGVHAGGGGGRSSTSAMAQQSAASSGAGGGGSGGAILIEGAGVTLDPFSLLAAAGGGGGGAGGSGSCGTAGDGADAPPGGSAAPGGVCPRPGGGEWARGGDGASLAGAQSGGGTGDLAAGSGGGGLGYLRINTPTGSFAGEASAVIRGVLTTGTVQVQ